MKSLDLRSEKKTNKNRLFYFKNFPYLWNDPHIN